MKAVYLKRKGVKWYDVENYSSKYFIKKTASKLMISVHFFSNFKIFFIYI